MTGCLRSPPGAGACSLDLRTQDAGDGLAVFVVFILGAVVVALAVEVAFSPPAWVHGVLWTPVVIGGAIGLLRPLKAGLIALQYRHRLLGSDPSA